MLRKYVILAAGSLTACGVPANIPIETRPVDPVYTQAAKTVKANHVRELPVRTFTGASTELTGVPCKISTEYYVVEVTTPALPATGGLGL